MASKAEITVLITGDVECCVMDELMYFLENGESFPKRFAPIVIDAHAQLNVDGFTRSVFVSSLHTSILSQVTHLVLIFPLFVLFDQMISLRRQKL